MTAPPPDDDHVEGLLGAYALDAVDEDDRRQVDELLRIDPVAAREVDEHRETAAILAWSSAAPPERVSDRLAASLHGRASEPLDELARASARRRRRGRLAFAGVMSGAAILLAVVFTVGPLRRDNGQATMRAAMEHASRSPEARQISLLSEDGSEHVEVVLDKDGHGFVAGSTLPPLASDRTYQLWGVFDEQVISLGVLGHRPGVESFSADGNLTALVITNEVAGGVPTNGNPAGALSATVG